MANQRRISTRRIQGYLHQVDNGATAEERGRALEDLMSELFLCVPSIDLHLRNAIDYADAGEIDLILMNDYTQKAGFYFFSAVVLVECKNWCSPVGSAEVRVFVDRMRERACQHGVLIATHGITGEPKDLSSAHHIVARALELGFHVIVLTREDLQNVRSVSGLVARVKQKFLMLKAFKTSL